MLPNGRRAEISDTDRMLSRASVVLAAVAIAAAALVLWRFQRAAQPEPSFHGRPLHVWLNKLERCEMAGIGAQADEQRAVMHDLGTNALPTLVYMLTVKDSPLTLRLISLAQKQHLIKFKFRRAELKHLIADNWLEMMGPEAAPAVPDLIQHYRRDPSPYSRAFIAEVFGTIGPGARDAIPALLPDATSGNNYLRGTVITSLGKIHSDPQRVVPVLINSLRDTEDDIRVAAADSLGEFGEAARPAVPALMGLLTEHSRDEGEDVAEALSKIKPKPADTPPK